MSYTEQKGGGIVQEGKMSGGICPGEMSGSRTSCCGGKRLFSDAYATRTRPSLGVS